MASMRRFVLRDEQGELFLHDDEVVRKSCEDIELAFSASTEPVGVGKLLITSQRIVWMKHGTESQSFDFDAQYIILHAITHDVNSYPKPCLYCQLDCEESNENDNDSDDMTGEQSAPDDVNPTEMFLVPSDPQSLQSLFDAFSAVAMENPDDTEDFDGDLIYDMDEVQLGSEQAQALAHLESIFVVPDDMAKKDKD
jgi:Regulator of volume decrease after cellular swelling